MPLIRTWLYPDVIAAAWIWALLAAVWPTPSPLDEAEWAAAEQAVNAMFQPGDAVLVHPGWLPGADRRFPGKPLLLGAPTTPEERLRFGRFLVVTADGSLPGGLIPNGEAQDLGELILRPARAGADAPAGPRDLIARLPEARVSLIRGSREEACGEWRAGAWRCPGPEWNHVGPTEMTIAGAARTCLWAHPRSDAELVVRFPALQLGPAITGHYGLSDAAATTPGGQPVRFVVALDGQSVLERTAPNRVGWRAFRVETGSRAGGLHELSFHISTRQDGRRHFCFAADPGGE